MFKHKASSTSCRYKDIWNLKGDAANEKDRTECRIHVASELVDTTVFNNSGLFLFFTLI